MIWGVGNFILNLRYFNFGDKFIKWIKKLYNDVYVKVRNGNLTSREIPVQKGLKQGRLLDMYSNCYSSLQITLAFFWNMTEISIKFREVI